MNENDELIDALGDFIALSESLDDIDDSSIDSPSISAASVERVKDLIADLRLGRKKIV